MAQAQTFGVSMAYSTNNALGVDFLYSKNMKDRFHLGYTQQLNGQHGERRNAGTSNFGRTSQGGAYFFNLVDFGYSRMLNEKWVVHGEFSTGSNNNYTNYSDRRFTSGGYYDINYKESISGGGIDVGYKFAKMLEVYAGYHTLKKALLGVRIVF